MCEHRAETHVAAQLREGIKIHIGWMNWAAGPMPNTSIIWQLWKDGLHLANKPN